MMEWMGSGDCSRCFHLALMTMIALNLQAKEPSVRFLPSTKYVLSLSNNNIYRVPKFQVSNWGLGKLPLVTSMD